MISSHFFNEAKHQISFVLLESVSFDWPPDCCLDERLDPLETLQGRRDQLLNFLVPVILSSRIREEDLQTISMQYSLLKNTIISMVVNLDAVD